LAVVARSMMIQQGDYDNDNDDEDVFFTLTNTLAWIS
jgi:hypothetical protein